MSVRRSRPDSTMARRRSMASSPAARGAVVGRQGSSAIFIPGSWSRAPRGATPRTPPTTSRSHWPWAPPPTRLNTAPARRRPGSKSRKPCTVAAMLRAESQQSMTSTTGASSHLATCAVLPSSVRPSVPSNRPPAPSTTATSASSQPRRYARARPARPRIQGSRLYVARPQARQCEARSTKLGPTLNGATRRPRARSAAMRPTATAVFPAPRPPPATTTQGGPCQGKE